MCPLNSRYLVDNLFSGFHLNYRHILLRNNQIQWLRIQFDTDQFTWLASFQSRSQNACSLPSYYFLLTHARIHPEKPLPTQATVELGKLRPFTGAIDVEFGAKDAQHRFSTFCVRPGTLLRHAVDRAALLVVLQTESETFGTRNVNL